MSSRLASSIVSETATLRDAMQSLEVSMSQIVLVADGAGRLLGTITDGDIRRAILAGQPLERAALDHANRRCFTVAEGTGRADILELMQARQIAQVPVVDSDGRVVGLHLLQEMVTQLERPNWAVIMAGGRGTRLGDLTHAVPKPMLPVAGRPILERIVLHLVGSGIRRIFLSVNYLGETIQAHFGDGDRFGCAIEYLWENEPLGTGGSLSLLPTGDGAPAHPLLIMNGDLVTQADVATIIDFHERGDQAVTMAVRRYLQPIPFGCVDVEGDTLVRFTEKPTASHLINAGIYVMDPAWLDIVPRSHPTTMPQVIEDVRERGGAVRIFEIDDEWIDVGRRDELERARRGE